MADDYGGYAPIATEDEEDELERRPRTAALSGSPAAELAAPPVRLSPVGPGGTAPTFGGMYGDDILVPGDKNPRTGQPVTEYTPVRSGPAYPAAGPAPDLLRDSNAPLETPPVMPPAVTSAATPRLSRETAMENTIGTRPTVPTYAPPVQSGLKRFGDVAISTLGNLALPGWGLGTRIAENIPWTTEAYNRKFGTELGNYERGSKDYEQRFKDEEELSKEEQQAPVRAATVGEAEARADELRAQAEGLRRGKTGLTPEETTMHDLMAGGENGTPRVNPQTGKPYTNLEAYQAVKQAAQDTKPDKVFTNPFEAFSSGTPEQKRAAQDFIKFEKQQGARYERPGEVEQRYSLYQRDPEAYKAMYGDREGAQAGRDQAHAVQMLRYFDSQRKSIDSDFTLDDQTKQQKLQELGELEKPYLEAAQAPSASRAGGNAGGGEIGPRKGEVEVISPNGQRGYVPRANLSKALKRGYKQAGTQ